MVVDLTKTTVRDFISDDTAAIQAGINATPVGDELYFPPGVYKVVSLNLKPGIRYRGEQATLKRPDNLASLIGGIEKAKWNRMLTTEKSPWKSSDDSPMTEFKGLILDGNVQNQPEAPYSQAHLLFLHADRTMPGRLKALIEDCQVINGTTDGVSIYNNTDVEIRRLLAQDCPRGGVVLTGGYSRLKMQDIIIRGFLYPGGIDVEVDGKGYGDSFQCDILIDNLLVQDGDYDVALSNGSTLVGNNIKVLKPTTYFYNKKAFQSYYGCHFSVGIPYYNNVNSIVHPGQMHFHNCKFMAHKHGESAYYGCSPYIQWNISGTYEQDQMLVFNDCNFDSVESLPELWGIVTGADLPELNNVLAINGGTISDKCKYGMRSKYYGGKWRIYGLNNLATIPYSPYGITTQGSTRVWQHYFDVLMDNVKYGNSQKYLEIRGFNEPGNKLVMRNVILPDVKNYITSEKQLENMTTDSKRIITSDMQPNSQSHGFIGDEWHCTNGLKWRCTKHGYVYSSQLLIVPSEWEQF